MVWPLRSLRGCEVVRGWAMAMVVLLALQAMGLQLLCFCGHCPTSRTLGIQATDAVGEEALHSCCAKALDEQAIQLGVGQATADAPCCGDEHQLRAADATAQGPREVAVHPALVIGVLRPDFDTAELTQLGRERAAASWARGPPDTPAADLAILQQRFLI